MVKKASALNFWFGFIGFWLISGLIAGTIWLGLKSYVNQSKYPYYQSSIWDEDAATSIKFNIFGKYVKALVTINNKAEYVELLIDPELKQSTLSKEFLDKFRTKFYDFDYTVDQKAEGFKLKRSLIVPVVLLPSAEGRDFIIERLNVAITKKDNIIGQDLLSLFNYTLNYENSSLDLKLFKEEQALIVETSQHVRNTKAYLYAKIRKLWQDQLARMQVEHLDEFIKIQQMISNNVEVSFDTVGGYVVSAKLLKASKNKYFNQYTEEFLRNLPRFYNFPEEIKRKPRFTIEMNLSFKPAKLVSH